MYDHFFSKVDHFLLSSTSLGLGAEDIRVFEVESVEDISLLLSFLPDEILDSRIDLSVVTLLDLETVVTELLGDVTFSVLGVIVDEEDLLVLEILDEDDDEPACINVSEED